MKAATYVSVGQEEAGCVRSQLWTGRRKKMSISHWALICGLGIVLAAPTTAQEPHGTLFVSGNMDIFQSGGQNDGSGGVPPFAFTFPAASNRFLIFESILGLWTCADGNPVAVPWGRTGPVPQETPAIRVPASRG